MTINSLLNTIGGLTFRQSTTDMYLKFQSIFEVYSNAAGAANISMGDMDYIEVTVDHNALSLELASSSASINNLFIAGDIAVQSIFDISSVLAAMYKCNIPQNCEVVVHIITNTLDAVYDTGDIIGYTIVAFSQYIMHLLGIFGAPSFIEPANNIGVQLFSEDWTAEITGLEPQGGGTYDLSSLITLPNGASFQMDPDDESGCTINGNELSYGDLPESVDAAIDVVLSGGQTVAFYLKLTPSV